MLTFGLCFVVGLISISILGLWWVGSERCEIIVCKYKTKFNKMETKKETEKGFVNVYINITTKQVHVSNKPYPTMEEAEKGVFHGVGIEKAGCFEIEYTKHEQTFNYESNN